jgi:hypothetical protein
MTFMTVEKQSSPNCVRVFAQQQQNKQVKDIVALKVVPSSPTASTTSSANMDATQLAALTVVNPDEQRDDSNKVTSSLDKASSMSICMVRNVIFQILVHMGTLSSQFMDAHRITEHHAAIGTTMGLMMTSLIDLSFGLSINLHDACLKKIQLNQRKYPVELCKVGIASCPFAILKLKKSQI